MDGVSRGDLVVSNLPEEASKLASERHYLAPGIPVIKTVRALDGDRVCEIDGVLEINGAPTVRLLPADRLGRALPSPWKGCSQLQPGEVLLLSDRTPDSFDGRYFGAVRKSDIVGQAVWLGGAGKQPVEDGFEESGMRPEVT
ncbi:S26 family signal peptidase, partial [Hyphomonas chukchiensis]|uniref:S26 family signal peptidase n=1 Tax=Hyphomonas chukchiensis TaxID=1280947 RepID=UPI003BB0CDC1